MSGAGILVHSLEALGAKVVFGLPAVHVLDIWESLRSSTIRAFVLRTELDAAFAAEAYAMVSGEPAPLVVSTGPGSLISLAGVMEAASAHVPMVVVASHVPREFEGRGKGYLHELADQIASFTPIVKWARLAASASSIPGLLSEAWNQALEPPSGPVYLGVPFDVLAEELSSPSCNVAVAQSQRRGVAPSDVREAADLLAEARAPAIWAGGGVLRSGAWNELRALAEKLGAPVATTFMGKGSISADHPLAVGSACDEPSIRGLLESADVVLAVGTELGTETTGHFSLTFAGSLIHADAAAERIGVNYAALGLVGDARTVLSALADQIQSEPSPDGEARARDVRDRVRARLGREGERLSLTLLESIRETVPPDTVTTWDNTILAYWAAGYFPVLEPRTFLYPLGSGTIGYSLAAAIGAATSDPARHVVAVIGDGGIGYSLADLATLTQYALPVIVIVVDDGAYGILKHYQDEQFGATFGVELQQPGFDKVASAFGIPCANVEADDLQEALERAIAREGPSVLVVKAKLVPPLMNPPSPEAVRPAEQVETIP